MKKILLGSSRKKSRARNQYALVDDGDYEEINKYKWHISDNRSGTYYAIRTTKRDENGKQKTIRMHNQIMGTKFIDHIDHNGLNNTKANLRPATRTTNMMNRRVNKNSFTGYKGVTFRFGKFCARISVNKKRIHLGFFDNLETAAKEYNKAAVKYFGEFARINIIPTIR